MWRTRQWRAEQRIAAGKLTEVHRRLAKLYGSLARHHAGTRSKRLWERSAQHAREAELYGRLVPRPPAEGGRTGGGLGWSSRDLDGPLGVRHPRGPRAPVLAGGAEAEVEEDVR